MPVHVDQIHTDVVATGAARETEDKDQDKAPRHLGAAQEAWREAERKATQLYRRTAAEGFDD
jgi:hypothetical protein